MPNKQYRKLKFSVSSFSQEMVCIAAPKLHAKRGLIHTQAAAAAAAAAAVAVKTKREAAAVAAAGEREILFS